MLAQFTPGCMQRAQAEAISTQTYQAQGRALQGFVPAVSSQHKPPFCDKISAELIRKACPRLCAHALASLPGQHRILPPPSLAPWLQAATKVLCWAWDQPQRGALGWPSPPRAPAGRFKWGESRAHISHCKNSLKALQRTSSSKNLSSHCLNN